MKLFINTLLIIDLILIISTFLSAKYYIRYRKKIKKTPEIGSDNKKYFVLLPAFKEQELVKETLDYYSHIKVNNCKVMVITSEQEEYENRINKRNIKTTKDCVDKYLSDNRNSNIIHLHGNYTKGTKSTQLNFALDTIKDSLKDNEYSSCYIGVYDFDSRPNLDVIDDLSRIVNTQNSPEIVQQIPINTKNYNRLVKQKNYAMIVHCFQTMIRSVGIELASLFLNMKKICAPLYCMGAGMYIRMDTLLENGCFPEPIDDLELGYRLYLKGKRFGLFPEYNSVERPSSVREIVKQDVGIFNGVCLGVFELNTKATFVRKIILGFTILHNILLRTVIPWIYLGYLLFCLFKLEVDITMISILFLPILRTLVGGYALFNATPNRIKCQFSGIIGIITYSYLWRMIRTFGPFKYIFSKQ